MNKAKLSSAVLSGGGLKHTSVPYVLLGENNEFPKGTLLDANYIKELISGDDVLNEVHEKVQEVKNQLDQIIEDMPEEMDTFKEVHKAVSDNKNTIEKIQNKIENNETLVWIDAKQISQKQ